MFKYLSTGGLGLGLGSVKKRHKTHEGHVTDIYVNVIKVVI